MAILPELFDSDDYGYAVVLHDGVVPEDKLAQADQAAANCPERAITLADI